MHEASLGADLQRAQRLVDELGRLLGALQSTLVERDSQSTRWRQLEKECAELREKEASARRDCDRALQALAEARATCESLRKQQQRREDVVRSHRVMVVDDAPSELRVMADILKSAGHEVLAYDGGNGLEERVAAERPDVLLLDIVMPDRNGYELLRALKKDDRTKSTPVVVVTSRNRDSDRLWSQRQGADEYVTKPFTPEQLLMAVERVAR
jgi:CheY-like chemotaxis protein